MELTRNQIEAALDSAKDAQNAIDELTQILGQDYGTVESLNELIENLLDLLEADLVSEIDSE